MIRTLTIAVALLSCFVGQLNALDRKTLDLCEAKLSAKYESCKKEHTPSECNRGLTTRLCDGIYWNETYGALIDRRIEESAAPGMPHVFSGLTKIKTVYRVAGGAK